MARRRPARSRPRPARTTTPAAPVAAREQAHPTPLKTVARLHEAITARPCPWVLAATLVGAAIPRVWAALFDDSVFYPDEIFQTLEQGHRAAFGYGFIPWEFREAARSWLYPGALAILLKVGASVGIESGPGLAHLAKLGMVVVALCGGWATAKLAFERGGISAACLAGASYAAYPPLVILGARCTTELASSALVAAAALLLYGARRGERRAAFAGIMLGTTVFLRYQNGLLVLGFAAALLGARRLRDAAYLAAGCAGAGLLAGGLLDWLSWGKPFESMLVYLRFNMIEGGSAHWGTSPWWFYLRTLFSSSSPAACVLLLGLVLAAPSETAIVSIAAAYGLALSVVPHKQIRFLLPVLPIAIAAAGIGLARTLERAWTKLGASSEPGSPLTFPPIAIACALMLASSFGLKSARATYADMGYPTRGGHSVWRLDDGATRLLGRVGARPDLCGLMLTGIDVGYTGAFSYLHRDVPFFNDDQSDSRASANYLIAMRSAVVPGDYEWLESAATYALFRREGTCAPPPSRYSLETGEDPLPGLEHPREGR